MVQMCETVSPIKVCPPPSYPSSRVTPHQPLGATSGDGLSEHCNLNAAGYKHILPSTRTQRNFLQKCRSRRYGRSPHEQYLRGKETCKEPVSEDLQHEGVTI